MKQLAFSSWKANLTQGNLSTFHKTRNKCVSTLRRARKHLSNLKNELSNLSPSCITWWHLVKSVSGVCSPSIPSFSSNGITADPPCVRRRNTSIRCLLPHLVSPTPHSQYPHYLGTPDSSWTLSFTPKVEKVPANPRLVLQLNRMASSHVS